ncbi:hypothetical protein baBA2_000150 [Borrelia anserina]|uniref:Uncharacterized protein n=2 Tax=Borrelia anserina TaxID=143 RepID=W5SNZ8_BORAN|nr:hypothetical protein [Borrelia anserina]AHH08119.1 Hypothetical protein BAN_0099600 [Borrelia anserina BA2]AHH08874.1 Hypothetical protein BAN_0099601 [Borrelia anserina BA2]APR64657.1 hypothetical protein N187_00750 [Borrelia anserina Es]UPA06570.1 hypothetical protein baBA2_000150 [Borrelia anserina]
MLQIYFISVLLNILGGLILAFPILEGKFKCLIIFEEFVNLINHNKNVRSIFGTIFLIISIFEIIIPYDLPIVGNLLPAISLFLIGFILSLSQKVPINLQNNKEYGKFTSFIESNKKLIGILALIIGIMHFLAPKVPLL